MSDYLSNNKGVVMTKDSEGILDTGETQASEKNIADTDPNGVRGEDMGKGFFEEKPGHRSMMRAMSLIALLAAIFFGWLALKGVDESSSTKYGVFITFGFLLAAFAPKALQKYAEGAIPA